MSLLQTPKAPSDLLRRESARILPRLRLIIEFRPWLDYIKHTKRNTTSPFALLWETFALGVSLATLLNLLGSPPPRDLPPIDNEKIDLGLGLPHREKYFSNFIQRVQLLELQQKIPFGEVLRVQDLFGGTNSGFAKVLKTVDRVLNALQDSYPGVFVLPKDAPLLRQEYLSELLDTELAHVAILRMTGDSAELLSEESQPPDMRLECLIVNRAVLRQYHDQVLRMLEDAVQTPLKEKWEEIFAFEDQGRKNAVGAYRAICANYLDLADVLRGHLNNSEPLLSSHAQILLDNVSALLTRTSTYFSILEKILLVTSPADSSTYHSLCSAVHHLGETSENLNEMGHLLRTMYSSRIFKGRAFTWRADIDPSELGPLLLDDLLAEDPAGTQHFAVFLFEMMLLCCTEGAAAATEEEQGQYQYPVRPGIWALHSNMLRLSDSDALELDWVDERNKPRVLQLYAANAEQYEQWCRALEMFVPSVYTCSHDERRIFRTTKMRPRSETSSLFCQEGCLSDQESLLSPNLLPRFFGPGSQEVSPLAINTTFPRGHLGTGDVSGLGLGFDVPPTPPPESEPFVEDDPTALLDLTGQIKREGSYAQAHGGFADVWKGVWNKQPDRWVAVKVLRSRLDDLQMEGKMRKRLARELGVWKRLDHKHVLKLLGTVSDFGPYDSMVCPWFEQGSVSKYMERRGDILSMTDRLQLLCEVADGLNYLHENSIVHGDLTGSNILIDDEGKALLCDFGLSSIVAELRGTSALTSCIGGAVRWADSAFYTLCSTNSDDVDDDESEEQETPVPALTTRSDIYSSAASPSKSSLVESHTTTSAQTPKSSSRSTEAINPAGQHSRLSRMGNGSLFSAIGALHRASLEFRRHTY
ncbi:TKL/TKL-ccin protein kinase [Roridomyces roridus]|uniref:TKL/TKL-ccin protein kinase n=1 Tax=Roridomyces roridus TaxID=1738132 RepID=A0AAD7BG26_9AGAR|nr:TKL/TKL-ccin protein kinase [Roridomyces roridus]